MLPISIITLFPRKKYDIVSNFHNPLINSVTFANE